MIRNGSKQTISTSSGFGLLQMVLETDIGRCASEGTGPPNGGFSSVGEENDTFLIRM